MGIILVFFRINEIERHTVAARFDNSHARAFFCRRFGFVSLHHCHTYTACNQIDKGLGVVAQYLFFWVRAGCCAKTGAGASYFRTRPTFLSIRILAGSAEGSGSAGNIRFAGKSARRSGFAGIRCGCRVGRRCRV